MPSPQPAFFHWSTGKDSALALWRMLQNPAYRIEHLLTTFNTHHDRVSMHGLRRSLFEAQMQRIGLPYSTVELPEQPDMVTYETALQEAVLAQKAQGRTLAGLGDIFLEDLRQYREKQHQAWGVQPVFPLWGEDSHKLLDEFWQGGFQAIVICTDAQKLDPSFCGRLLDEAFVRDLPTGVDPCGENGEFHTFCFAAPFFKSPVDFQMGEKVLKTYPAPAGSASATLGFWFCDLLPS
ncbi:MAG TPA: ATP-binding protein [Microscillaceae bacterium]|jgi:uncharacterized protein (TIGR00290 family)|nr:ATP-binding protein [Microscillaceae bacterium]